MRNTKVLIIASVIAMFFQNKLGAQEVFVAVGGNAIGTSTSSFTIGQTFYSNITSNSHSLVEGVQQPYEIYSLGVTDSANLNSLITLYPNPAEELLQVQLNELNRNLTYIIYDINGKLLTEGKLNKLKNQIVVSQLPSSVYFITIQRNSSPIETFKFIKK